MRQKPATMLTHARSAVVPAAVGRDVISVHLPEISGLNFIIMRAMLTFSMINERLWWFFVHDSASLLGLLGRARVAKITLSN